MHKPLLKETIATLRGGNQSAPSAPELVYWLDLFPASQLSALDIAMGNAPQAVFPLPVYRKFGGNAPMEIFLAVGDLPR